MLDLRTPTGNRAFDPDSLDPSDLAMARADRGAMIRTARMNDDEYAAHLATLAAAGRCDVWGEGR
jgi:hypothetical protein